MRLTKTIDLGDRRVEVRELTIGEIRKAVFNTKEDIRDMTLEDLSGDGLLKLASHFLPMTSLDIQEIETLTISELKAVIAGIQEVNQDFFDLVGGLEGVLKTLSSQLESLTAAAQSSSNAVTPGSSTTDGAFSPAPAKS